MIENLRECAEELFGKVERGACGVEITLPRGSACGFIPGRDESRHPQREAFEWEFNHALRRAALAPIRAFHGTGGQGGKRDSSIHVKAWAKRKKEETTVAIDGAYQTTVEGPFQIPGTGNAYLSSRPLSAAGG